MYIKGILKKMQIIRRPKSKWMGFTRILIDGSISVTMKNEKIGNVETLMDVHFWQTLIKSISVITKLYLNTVKK